jgi:hypothetical protein
MSTCEGFAAPHTISRRKVGEAKTLEGTQVTPCYHRGLCSSSWHLSRFLDALKRQLDCQCSTLEINNGFTIAE